jgi:hypothetical protein
MSTALAHCAVSGLFNTLCMADFYIPDVAGTIALE